MKKFLTVIGIIFVIAIIRIGYVSHSKQIFLNEKREYASTTLVQDFIKSSDKSVQQFMSDYSSKNEDKYILIPIKVDDINENSDTITYELANTSIECFFDYYVDKNIKKGNILVISGNLKHYDESNNKLELDKCRVENSYQNMLTNFKTENDEFNQKVAKLQQDAKNEADSKVKAEAEAKAQLEEEANKIISTDFTSFEKPYASKTEIQKDSYYNSIEGRYVQWTGTVREVDKHTIGVKCLDSTVTEDFIAIVSSSEESKLMDIQMGSTITIKGKISQQEGNILPWALHDCIIVK